MPNDDSLDAQASLTRAEEAEEQAQLICELGLEYGAVALFYGAYHRARHALLTDPVFENPSLLARVNVNLTMGDRATTRHHGYTRIEGSRQVRIWGINELVALLYPTVASDYEILHQGSLDVRYRARLDRSLDHLRDCGQRIRQAQNDGLLIYRAPDPPARVV